MGSYCWPDDLNVGKPGWSLESRCWWPEYCSLLTSHQSRMYTDIETLYRTTIARNPACWMAQVNLGNILYQANRIPEAMDLFKQALRIKPAVAHYSLGNALVRKGRTSEAIERISSRRCGSILIMPRRTITWATPYC